MLYKIKNTWLILITGMDIITIFFYQKTNLTDSTVLNTSEMGEINIGEEIFYCSNFMLAS